MPPGAASTVLGASQAPCADGGARLWLVPEGPGWPGPQPGVEWLGAVGTNGVAVNPTEPDRHLGPAWHQGPLVPNRSACWVSGVGGKAVCSSGNKVCVVFWYGKNSRTCF